MASSEESECRMYEKEFPSVDDLVVVRVNRVTDIGAYVSLLEYCNREGIILLSNLSRKRIRSVNKHVRVGRQEVLQVLRVDQDKGYIDLSKKLIQKEDVVECTNRYKKSKQVHSVMQRVSTLTGMPLEELYQKVGWPLYKKHGHAFDALTLIVSDPSILNDYAVSQPVKDELIKIIQQRMSVHPFKVQTDLEVTCASFQGIEAIKGALRAGMATGTEQEPVSIQLITTPLYMVSVTTLDTEQGIEMLNRAVDAIQKEIKKQGGSCIVKVAPRAIAN
ncbi:MAG: S1 RNA-binding domain-containing protein [archaeon]|nr:S1 RNA-binding domain-containing protein [archaeon]